MKKPLMSLSRKSTADCLESRLSELSRIREPIWVYDFDNACIPWANTESLSVWQAKSLDELRSRDLATDMTQTVANRLRQYQADFTRDEDIQFREIWTLYPNGEPQTVEVLYSAFRLDDGRMAMMCEALMQDHHDNETLRSAEALLHTSVMITLYNNCLLYTSPSPRDS